MTPPLIYRSCWRMSKNCNASPLLVGRRDELMHVDLMAKRGVTHPELSACCRRVLVIVNAAGAILCLQDILLLPSPSPSLFRTSTRMVKQFVSSLLGPTNLAGRSSMSKARTSSAIIMLDTWASGLRRHRWDLARLMPQVYGSGAGAPT